MEHMIGAILTSGFRFFSDWLNTARVFLVQCGRTGNYIQMHHKLGTGERNIAVKPTSSISVVATLVYLDDRFRSAAAENWLAKHIPFLIVTMVIALGWHKSREVEHHCTLQ